MPLSRSPIIIIPKKLFNDEDFNYNSYPSILCINGQDPGKVVKWMRPHEMVAEPELYVDGTSRRDVIQGILGIMLMSSFRANYSLLQKS